ncbi:hypothetical protein ACOME3_006912 [Neoechinorhynchus agilis]
MAPRRTLIVVWTALILVSLFLYYRTTTKVKVEDNLLDLINGYECKNQIRVGDVGLIDQAEYPDEYYKNRTHGRVDLLWFVCMDKGVGPVMPGSLLPPTLIILGFDES